MKMIALYVILLVITAFSCEDNLQDPVPVEFEFRLLNEQGKPSTTFKEGENFIFSFSFVNESDEDIWFRQNSFEREKFLRVYQILDGSEAEDIQDFGKPYKGLFCAEIAGILIQANEKREFQIPWSAPGSYFPEGGIFFCFGSEALPLPFGKYFTEFSSDFEFSMDGKIFTTGVQKFKIEFSIF